MAVSATVKLRWKPLLQEEWKAIPQTRRSAFKRSKGKKHPPARGADIAGHFYLDIYEAGRRQYRFLELKTTRDARANDEIERLAREVERRAQDDKWRSAHGFESALSRGIPFVQFFRSLVPGRPIAWRACQYALEAFPLSDAPIETIDEKWLESFKQYLFSIRTRGGSTLKQNSASTYYAKIKAALSIAVDQKLIPSVPRVKAIPMEDTERSYLMFEEIQALAIAHCPDAETKRAFLTSCYTGLRLSDILELRKRHFQNGRLEKRIKKTNKVQYLDLPPVAQRLLINGGHQEPDEKVFSLPHPRVIWDVLQVWSKNAGLVKHISFHTARHSFAVLALSHTNDLYLVKELLDHTNIRDTQRYAKIVDDRKRDAMLSLPEIQLS